MEKGIITTASTIEEAIEDALRQLETDRENTEIEIIEKPTEKLFGSPTKAKVKVTLRVATFDNDSEEENDKVEDADEAEEAENDALKDDEAGNELNNEYKEAADEDEINAHDSDEHDSDEKNYNKASVQLTEDELDTIADTAIDTIQNFLKYFGVDEAAIDEYEGEEGELIFDIVGESLAVLIGRHGKTLDSFQFLVSSIVGKKTGYRHPIIIDVEGYRHRRKQKLVSMAKSSAARVIRQKHEINLRPMSPYERRIIHVALKDDKRIITSSDGTEPNRYVVIRLA
jgi:spoIIIJ-associated protein